MLKQLSQDRLTFYRKPDPFAAKALLPFVAYLNTPNISQVFEITNEENEPIGVFSSIGRTTFLYLCKPVELNKLVEWELNVFAKEFLMADSKMVLEREKCNIICTYAVMEKAFSGRAKRQENLHGQNLFKELSDAFAILKSWESDFVFDQYYPDTHHIIRHGLAQVMNLHQSGQVVATAMISGAFGDYGVLQNIGVAKGQQGKGYGKTVVNKLLSVCSFEKVGLMCEKELVAFYEKSGFKKTGECLIIKP